MLLAAQGEDLGRVGLTMLAFGLGAALPLLLLGSLSRQVLMRWRDRLARGGKAAKAILGALLIVMAVLILTGYDKRLTVILLEASPAWLTRLTTRF